MAPWLLLFVNLQALLRVENGVDVRRRCTAGVVADGNHWEADADGDIAAKRTDNPIIKVACITILVVVLMGISFSSGMQHSRG
jgi:hypothetical protein